MKNLDYLINELKKIENNEDSFLGIDGGSIVSKIWVCGVEFGSDLKQMEKYYEEGYVKYINNIPYREDCPEYFLKSTYDRYLSIMYNNLFNKKPFSTPINKDSIEKILKENLYNTDSKIFKLNLYPLAKKDTSWDKKIENQLNIKKEKYYNEIFNNRKFFFKKLIKEHKPEIIICTSPKHFENEFVEAFFDKNLPNTYTWNYINDGEFKISEYDNGITKLVIIPFLGRGNLASHNDVIEMSDYLRTKYLN